jgi:ketosteroid isomerase-like protein
MDAHQPNELPLVFQHYLNAGDLPGLMQHYYAKDAVYSPVPGVVLSGAEVEPSIGRLMSLGHPIEVRVRHVLAGEEVALIVLDWEIAGAGMRGTATDVARRQPDGIWRCIIDNPHGGAISIDLPPETAAVLSGQHDLPA